MSIAIPVAQDKGLQSPLSEHFGSAPFFAIVDEATGACRVIPNGDLHHSHGACHPLAALADEGVDSVVVRGIGVGALNRLQEAGVQVYLSELLAVEAAVTALRAGTLRQGTPAAACARHGQGHGACRDGARIQ